MRIQSESETLVRVLAGTKLIDRRNAQEQWYGRDYDQWPIEVLQQIIPEDWPVSAPRANSGSARLALGLVLLAGVLGLVGMLTRRAFSAS